MDPFFGDLWRFDGLGRLRLLLQPFISILLGIRDGRRDAQEGVPPYLYLIAFETSHGRASMRRGLTAIVMPLCVGVVMDGVLQVVVLSQLHFLAALVVGGDLVGLPSMVSHDLTNRLM